MTFRGITPLLRWGVPLTAGTVLLGGGLALVVWLRPPDPGPFPPAREGDPGGSRIHPPHGSVLTEPPGEFRWPAVAGADTYWVVLYDGDATVIWESVGIPDPVVPLPASVREIMSRAGEFEWTVSADIGSASVDSPRYRFRLVPPPP